MKSLTLYELNGIVREVLELSLDNSYWVEAELSELREHGGHCYMELVQKDENTNTPIAKASARCWRTTWMLLKPRFERVAMQRLSPGMKVLMKVSAQFHEQYGFSWIVSDIDPTYTMGDMARKRQEIINKLKAEGVFDLNRELRLPMLTQRIAVVSSKTAAGYGDFVDQLQNNKQGLKFHLELFAASMQGEQVEQSVIAALNAIYERKEEFDCVVIIRGGGATSDLSGFDTLMLAENVANFPLPVITGIGHERDESILDLVANTRMKTPTAVAAFLIDRMMNLCDRIDTMEQTIVACVERRLQMETMRIERMTVAIPHIFSSIREKQERRLDTMYSAALTSAKMMLKDRNDTLEQWHGRLVAAIDRRMEKETHRIEMMDKHIELSSPERILQRGYSITMKDGRAVTSYEQLAEGDTIETVFAKGTVRSVVEKKQDSKR